MICQNRIRILKPVALQDEVMTRLRGTIPLWGRGNLSHYLNGFRGSATNPKRYQRIRVLSSHGCLPSLESAIKTPNPSAIPMSIPLPQENTFHDSEIPSPKLPGVPPAKYNQESDTPKFGK